MIKKTVLLTILVSALLSCNDKEVVEEVSESGVNNVTLSIKQSAFTRGINGEKGATEYAVLGSGKLYFLNSESMSIFQRQLTPAEVNKLANTTSTPMSNDSVFITGVPSSAKKLYFMANIKTDDSQTFPAVEGTGSADARLRLDRLQGNAQNVPMAGISAEFTNIKDNNYRASVEISPIVARIEIEKATCQNANPNSQVSTDITGYKLSGIFINNINTYVLLSSQPYQNAPVNIANQAGWSSSDVSAYFENNPHFPYFAGGSIPTPSDWTHNAFVDYCSPTNAGLSFYPDVTNGSTTTTPTSTPKPAWAYQVCPSSAIPENQITPANDIPHIILKLTEVTYKDYPDGAKTLYVVVDKYMDSSTNKNILQFNRGNVYRIEDLTFNQSQTTIKPYDKNITVSCRVTVQPWVINKINPVW